VAGGTHRRAGSAVALLLALALAARAADDAAFTISGSVHDARGRPLAGAGVELRDGADVLAAATADRDGRFAVAVARERAARRPQPFGPVDVVATAPHCSCRVRTVPAGSGDVALVLPPLRPVQGVVRDDGGRALAGVEVVAASGDYRVTTTTDGEGRFGLPDAGPDLRELRLRGPAGRTALAIVPVSGNVEAALDLAGLGALVGTVVRRRDGTPVAGARVRVGEAAALCDARGAFRLLVEPRMVGVGWLKATRPELATVTAPGLRAEAVPLRPGLAARIPLAEAPGLAGRVTAAGGAPVAACAVTLVRPLLSGAIRIVTATGADGGFVFDSVPAPPFRLELRATGYLAAQQELEALPGGALDLVLDRGAGVRGRVVDAGGRPVTGAGVGDTYSDAGGAFAVTGLAAGRHELCARRGARRSVTVAVALQAGEERQVGDLVLADVLTVAGVVRDDEGRPVAGAEVACAGEGTTLRTRTDGEGAFSFGGRPLGRYHLRAAAPGHAEAAATVEAGDLVRLVVDRLTGKGVLLVRFTAPPAAEGRVTLWVVLGANPRVWRRREAEVRDGAVRFDDLRPGLYTVRARLGKGAEQQVIARVTEEEPAAVELTLEQGESPRKH